MSVEIGYFSIQVADVGRARKFYGGLFGWEFAADADDRYAHVTNITPPGGLGKGEAAPPQVWFRVSDIRAAVERLRQLGGHADEPRESPSGWGCACRDDQGGPFNLWQPAPGY